MKELALHLLDIGKNSTAAGATLVEVGLTETSDHVLTLVIADNGRGMSPQMLAQVTDPFTTTRTTRKVGMGLPLFRMTAEMTGGSLSIQSTEGVGTTVTAVLHTDHLDCPPLGDLPGVMAMLIQGSPNIDFLLTHTTPQGEYSLDTREIRGLLGPEVPLDSPEVFLWVSEYLSEQEANLNCPHSGQD